MTDTLSKIHDELDDVLFWIKVRIEDSGILAEQRLDEMVDEGNRRQLERMFDFTDPWRKLRLRVNSGVRTYAEQKALWESWREGKGVAFVAPGQQSHHVNHLAIDIGDTNADPLMFITDREGRTIRYWGEPWHFEYRAAAEPLDDRTWFEKARDRFASWNLKRHMRKAGML